MAVGLGSVWVVNGESLYKVDPAEGEPTEIAVGAGPGDVDVDNQHVWVANEDDDTVTRIDPFDDAAARTIEVGSEPHAIDAADGAVWVANSGDGTIQRISAEGARVTRTVEVGTGPTDLAIGSSSVWVVDNREGLLRRVDMESSEVASPPIEVAPKPRGGGRRLRLGLGGERRNRPRRAVRSRHRDPHRRADRGRGGTGLRPGRPGDR